MHWISETLRGWLNLKVVKEYLGTTLAIVVGITILTPIVLFMCLEHLVTHNMRKKKSWLDEIAEMDEYDPLHYDMT